jgi:uncharacterized iron-regulated membrane protein
MAILRTAHRWLGLVLALPMLIQAATGLFMVVSVPLDALHVPIVSSPTEPLNPLDAVIGAARDAATPGLVLLRYQAGVQPHDAASVDLGLPGQRLPHIRLYVDPSSLAILGRDADPDRVYRWFHSVHETLLLPGPFGRNIIGWCGIGLIVLAVTGVPIWWPRHGRWRAALTVPLRARGYRLQRGLHGAVGGWVVILLLLQAVSGVSMAFPQTAAALLGATQPRFPSASRGGRSDIDVAQVAAAALRAAPQSRLVSLRFPAEPGRPVMAALRPQGSAIDGPPTLVILDPSTQRVLGVRGPGTGSAGAGVLAWLRTLHEGAGLGPSWRLAVGLTGLALLIFPVTGVAMWLLRRSAGRRRRAGMYLQGAGE